MNKRSVLDNGTSIELYAEEKGKRDKREFHITKLISEDGASTVAYRAYHENSSNIGILREYYPLKDDLALDRDQNGRICLDMKETAEAERTEYLKGKERYLSPFLELRELQRTKENDELASFIPNFEIYYGSQNTGINDDGTVYIWTPAPQTETFEKICDEIHRNPTVESEYKLYTVLSCILHLALSVGELHSVQPIGLIHRDIKPDNFGFTKRQGEILPQSISLFDVDSICKVYPEPEEDIGTPGFMEKNDERRNDNLRDIYSIGATLFYAIIITETTKESGYKYNPDLHFDKIADLVKDSELIKSSDSNSFPRLRSYITRILKKCLCPRYTTNGRYEDCESLASDLRTAIGYIVPVEVSRNNISGENWVLQDARAWLDEHEESTSRLALQYNLYKYPLYRRAEKKDSLSILILGFGRYGYKFLDLALQYAQNLGTNLKVEIVSDSAIENDKTDEMLYLDERPEVTNFFNVSGKKRVKDAYGELEFRSLSLISGRSSLEVDDSALASLTTKKDKYDYIFVDLNNNAVNSDVSKELYRKGLSAWITYVREGNRDNGFSVEEQVTPVMVSTDVHEYSEFSDLERMAFNAHLVWNENTNISFEVKKKEFKEEYNFNSCVSNVLSIKYKLWRMGIDTDEISLHEAAKRIDEILHNNPEDRQYLTWLEHRRWVVEKICDGWKTRTIEQCYALAGTEDDVTRNKNQKEHICIVKGTAKWKLEGIDTIKWDINGIDASKLDPLDRLSVNLHRFYQEQADKLHIGDFKTERNQLLNSSALMFFDEWSDVKNEIIRKGDRDTAGLFKAHWIRLKSAIQKDKSGTLTDVQKKSIVSSIEQRIAPLLHRYEYKDYKKIDVDLVDRIPYILTYTEHLNLIYPLDNFDNVPAVKDIDISSEFVFRHVASATVLESESITYLYYAPERAGFNVFSDSIKLTGMMKRIIAYKKRKEARFNIKLVIFLHSEGTRALYEMSELNREDIEVEFVVIKEKEGPAKSAGIYINSIGDLSYTLIERNDASTSGWLSESNVLKMMSSYMFSIKEQKFYSIEDCEWIKYIPGGYSLGVREIAELSGRRFSIDENLDFGIAENAELWNIYKEDTARWKRCSKFLAEGKHSLTDLLICSRESINGNNKGTFKFYMPAKCYAAVYKCLKAFLKHGFVELGSELIACSNSICCLKVRCTAKMRDAIDCMLLDPYAFEEADKIKIIYIKDDGCLTIHYSGLKFEEINLKKYIEKLAADNQIKSDDKGKLNAEKEIISLLIKFHGKGIIHGLKTKGGIVSFSYGSYAIKKLMENAGNMLEFRVCQELSSIKSEDVGKSRYFDDVVGGITFQNNSNSKTEQIDCLVTKGFQSLIIECKAMDNLSEEQILKFAVKLKDRVDKYGISCRGLLLIDSNTPLDIKQHYEGIVIKRLDEIKGDNRNRIAKYVAELLTKFG